ncbi:MAG: PilZ domain-containing protein [Acidobacteriota bacterium]|nr:PilZ domain-containing protein [Acidobacteriota bacterium]
MLNSSKLEKVASEVIERRKSRRFPINLEVHFKTLNQRGERVEGIGQTLNISSSGVLFTSEYQLPIGTALEVSIAWPSRLKDGCFLNLIVRGRVTRQAKGELAMQSHQHEFRTQGRLGKEKQLQTAGAAVVLPGVNTSNCNGTGGSKPTIHEPKVECW